MINFSNSIFSKICQIALITLLFALPLALFAGDPIPGMDITVEQNPPGIKKSGTTNSKGELILSGFKEGPCVVTVVHEGKVLVAGKRGKDRIILPGNTKRAIKPIRLELSRAVASSSTRKGYDHYQAQSQNKNSARGNDKVVRKRPGGTLKAQGKESGGKPTLRANHNTTRSNRLAPAAADTDISGGKTPKTRAQDYNSSRSNTTTAKELDIDNDCDGVVDIIAMSNGRIKIVATCK